MTVQTALTGDQTIIAEVRKVNVHFFNVYNTGTASTAGTVDITNAAGTIFLRVRVTASDGGGTTNWHRFFDFPFPLEVTGGLKVDVTTATNVAYDIGYE